MLGCVAALRVMCEISILRFLASRRHAVSAHYIGKSLGLPDSTVGAALAALAASGRVRLDAQGRAVAISQKARRRCLACNKMFWSESHGNRRCDPCVERDDRSPVRVPHHVVEIGAGNE